MQSRVESWCKTDVAASHRSMRGAPRHARASRASSADLIRGHAMAFRSRRSSFQRVCALAGLVAAAGSCELQRPVTPRLADVTLLPGSTQAPPLTTPESPSSYPVLSQNPLDALDAFGWRTTDNEDGLLGIATAVGALLAAPDVLQFTYPIGFAGGTAPATEYFDFPHAKHFYASFAWKANANWQGHDSDVNKLAFVYLPSGAGDVLLQFYGPPGGPYDLRASLELVSADKRFFLVPNISNVPVQLGNWHQIEWQIEYNTTTSPANGIMRWWMDGTLIGQYTDILYPTIGMGEFQLSPTWGGVGDVKTQTDYFWYANAFLSGF
jgi:hypothetical protein